MDQQNVQSQQETRSSEPMFLEEEKRIDKPKLLNWKEAWSLAADWWEQKVYNPTGRAYSSTRVKLEWLHANDQPMGLCSTISEMCNRDLISVEIYVAMDLRISQEKAKHHQEGISLGSWLYPRTMEGAKQRVEFCRRVALEQQGE